MTALPKNNFLNNYCSKRVKPTLLRDVKTEALLVFCRTALERYFIKIDEASYEAEVGTHSDTTYVYETLRSLLVKLQESVVNVDYFMDLVALSNRYSYMAHLAKSEESLINYYDVTAKVISEHYKDKPAFLPEFLVICVLDNWISAGEHSVELYPFLKEIDYLELMSKFEQNRDYFQREGECTIKEIHQLSDRVTQSLENYKYKLNKNRTSKNRKKR